MQQTKDIMGTHVTVEVRDGNESEGCNIVFDYLTYIDETFSTYKPDSAISKINRGELTERQYSPDIKEIFKLAGQTTKETRGYFDIRRPEGYLDPSGIVKGWAIWQASLLLEKKGYQYFFIDAGGDIQARVPDRDTEPWRVGIRNPFRRDENIKVLHIRNEGVATSGTYERGQHIYDPHSVGRPIADIVSLTVVGPNIYEADRFATAAFAMGKEGIIFIENLKGFEGYMVDSAGIATLTSGFEHYATN